MVLLQLTVRAINRNRCEARSWDGWHRHMTLCMAALAFLARLRATLLRVALGKANEMSPALAA